MLRPDHIRKIVKDRGIGQLLHFTVENNLPSILEHGLLPRDELYRRDDIKAYASDAYRDDGHEDAICLTVTRYQQPMLKRVVRDNPGENWVMLVIKPAVLWENPCLFCDRNASSNWIKNTRLNLSTAYAFEAMFEDYSFTKFEAGEWVKVSRRVQTRTPASVPTDPQAEVLVKARIPVDRIAGVWIETNEQGERIKEMLQTVPESSRPKVFVGEYSFIICDGT